MRATRTAAAVFLGIFLLLAGCTTASEPMPEPEPVTTPGPTTGTRLAPGLYDLEDGTVQAVGTLEYQDLEGGFWAVIGGTQSEGNLGETEAVIANGQDFVSELEALDGRLVSVSGTRLEGASIRMAGPEIEMTSITEIVDSNGAAD